MAVVEEARRHSAGAWPRRNRPTLPNLVISLTKLSVDLGELGRREEGLTAIEEPVAIRRRLAQTYPATHLPRLAASLDTRSLCWATSGAWRRPNGCALLIWPHLAPEHGGANPG